jgi:solute carrier family 25 oxoglutarate transporter 11
MHSAGGGFSQFYTGFKAHMASRLSYLFIRNSLYKVIYDEVKPAKARNDLTIKEKMLLSGFVGGIAGYLSSPFELVSVRQICDTQTQKAWRRNYGEVLDALSTIKRRGTSIWRGAGLNAYKHIFLNISMTGPYDWLHERMWIVFGDYGFVKPTALLFASFIGAVATLPFDNWRTKWMNKHTDPTANRINAPNVLAYIDKCVNNEGSMLSPWVGFYPYFWSCLVYISLTVAITDSVTTRIKKGHPELESWMI